MSAPRFKYYMQCLDIDPIAFYSLKTGNGESDVSGQTLLEKGFPLPLTPNYTTWCQEVAAKRRCGSCYKVVRTIGDLENHTRKNHSFGRKNGSYC